MPLALLISLLLQSGDIPLRVERLDNGLNVTVFTDDALPLVSVQAWLHRGWLDATTPPSSALPHEIAACARHERRVYAEHTALTWTAPRELLPDLLRHAAGILASPPPAGPPATRIGCSPALRSRLFQSDPPGPPIPDAWPGRLVVIGDVVPGEVLPIVREATSDIEWRDQPRLPPFLTPRPAVAPPTGPRIAFAVPGLGAFEHTAHEVLLRHLVNPHDGPLRDGDRATGNRPRLTWQRDLWSSGGVLLVRTGDADESRQLLQTLRQLRDKPLPPTALRRAIALARAALRPRFGDLQERARTLGEHEAIAGDLLLAPLAAERIALVRTADIQDAAQRLLANAFPAEAADFPAQDSGDRAGRIDALPAVRSFAPLDAPDLTRDEQPGVTIICRRLAGAGHAALAALGAPAGDDWIRAHRDLLSYRGIQFEAHRGGFALRGSVGDEVALLEIAHRLLAAHADHRPTIAIVSDVPAADLSKRIAALALDWPARPPRPAPTATIAVDPPDPARLTPAHWRALPALLDFFPRFAERDRHDDATVIPPRKPTAAPRWRIPEDERAARETLAEARRRLWLDGPDAIAWHLAQTGGAAPLPFTEALRALARPGASTAQPPAEPARD